jgi:hypothetical protein
MGGLPYDLVNRITRISDASGSLEYGKQLGVFTLVFLVLLIVSVMMSRFRYYFVPFPHKKADKLNNQGHYTGLV